MHHPKAAKERITLPTDLGGLGIINIIQLHNNQINDLRKYFFKKANDITMFKCICNADKMATPLKLNSLEIQNSTSHKHEEDLLIWKQKTLHGTFPNLLNQDIIDKETSNLWLKIDDLYGETVGFMMAIQDRVIATRNYKKYILKETLENDKCRRCGTHNETIEHIISGCTTLAHSDYLQRHNNVAKIIHQQLALNFKLLESYTPYYKYEPQNVLDNQKFKIYWDREIRTDVTILANRPDIVIYNKEEQHIWIIDVAVPLSNNIEKTYATKINKYMELSHEMTKMWKAKRTLIIPIILSATGLTPKSLSSNLKQLNLEKLLPKIQKSVILDTCHITRRFLGYQDAE